MPRKALILITNDLIRPSETIMITKNTSDAIINTLACNVASAFHDYREGQINFYAYDKIRGNALTLATVHLDCFKELNNKLVEMGI